MSRIRVFIASSLDGFIAGPHDELDWLNSGDDQVEDTFTPFFAQIGAMLMGRRTYDMVSGFDSGWPYGDTPVLVATSRPLESSIESVRPVSGPIAGLVDEARELAGDRDVYVDGGALIRSALDADLIDELAVTIVPIALGAGIPLFSGLSRRHHFELIDSLSIGGGLMELSYRPRK